jgi:hypothetical protein
VGEGAKRVANISLILAVSGPERRPALFESPHRSQSLIR